MDAFDRSDPTQEAEIVFLLCLQPVLGHVDTVMDRRDCECGMNGSLMLTDRHVVDLRITLVHARQGSLMRMMQGADEGYGYVSGIGDRWRTIDMDQIARLRGFFNRPRYMIELLQQAGGLGGQRPLGPWIVGSLLCVDRGFAVAIHHRFDPPSFQAFCKMGNEGTEMKGDTIRAIRICKYLMVPCLLANESDSRVTVHFAGADVPARSNDDERVCLS